MRINGKIKTLRKKKSEIRVALEKPICVSDDQKIAIFKKVDLSWKLVATSLILDGLECEMIDTEKSIYDRLCSNIEEKNIEIINDLDEYNLEELTYSDLLDNITFKNKENYKLNITSFINLYILYLFLLTLMK